jgi:perosamine synthetase
MKIPLSRAFIDEDDINSVVEVLKSKWLTGGPKVIEFENKFSNYIGVKHAITVGNCTQALHLSMILLDLKPNDEVIIPTITFASSANCVLFVGAKPVLADIDEKTFNIYPESINEKITSNTKAIIPVHFGGQCCDMKAIGEIAKDHNLKIVEDSAHAIGSTFEGKKAGSFGFTGCFSFYPTKCMTTGEGGMVTTDDDKAAERLRLLRGHYMTKTAYEREREASWYYDVKGLGYNYRLSSINSALGISQLNKVDKMNGMRIKNAQYLTSKLKNIKGIITPFIVPGNKHIFYIYPIRIDQSVLSKTRDEVFNSLAKAGIECSVHYTPLHLLTLYKKMGYKAGDLPVAEKVSNEILSLPIFPSLKKEEMDYIVESLKDTLAS